MREGLLISGKLVGWRSAPAPPTPALLNPAAPLAIAPASATAMSFLPAIDLIFLQDTKNNFNFLVDSGASLSILPHTSTAPHTSPHLEGANGKPISGFRRRTVCFSGQNFEFDFLLAADATPLLGMDFLPKFGFSKLPSKQQVLHAASGRTFSKASTSSFISRGDSGGGLGIPRPPPLSPRSRHRYNCARNSRHCCAQAPTPQTSPRCRASHQQR